MSHQIDVGLGGLHYSFTQTTYNNRHLPTSLHHVCTVHKTRRRYFICHTYFPQTMLFVARPFATYLATQKRNLPWKPLTPSLPGGPGEPGGPGRPGSPGNPWLPLSPGGPGTSKPDGPGSPFSPGLPLNPRQHDGEYNPSAWANYVGSGEAACKTQKWRQQLPTKFFL